MSNEAAKGFAIIAMESLGYTKGQIEDVMEKMYEAMEYITNEQAESKRLNY